MFDERRIRKHGQLAEATVVSMDERSSRSNKSWRKYDYVLDVRPVDGEPGFRTELRQTFSMMESKPQAYDVVKVKFDASSHQVVFDLTGDHRFDLEAMKAHTLEVRAETARMRAAAAAGGAVDASALFDAATMFGGAQVVFGSSPVVLGRGVDAGPLDIVDAIERLAKLHESGALTTAQFDALKAKLLATPT